MASTLPSFSLSSSAHSAVQLRVENTVASSNCFFRTQVISGVQRNGKGRSVWRRRKLTKKDDMLRYGMDRVPFLEEQVRKVKDGGQLMGMDIERLLLSEDNRFDFVNEIAAEANEYVENNRDEYGGKKKAILQVLSNRVNDAGFYRPEAYEESDPFQPGPSYLKEFYT
ncbi:PREDICTED: uncharacterized protein LOC101305888 [Fragaria vesca subsp. vesca]|uniref:uncharacterized protein LOC101305888 n=1 Tax=Fragaria vesca subsp. vesca TaxID=101020 RepID=UPI0002C32F24|nr:PREDICTED: uncharacterized protein LOC101305888 [Fragaria vesca subsp. vesca]